MADEELTPQGGEADDVLENDTPDANQQDDQQEDPIASLAQDLGWKPKDQWEGDPDAWKPAAEFIRAGRDIQQSYARDVRSLREQMDRMANVTDTLIKDKVAERDAYWKQQFDQAVEDGDTDKANKLLEQRPAPAPAGPDLTVTSWVAKNEWYNKDPLAQARAKEISDRLAHLPVPDQLVHVERAIRKEFPEHFPGQAKQPPATQTAATRSTDRGNRAKGFADMPAESRAMAQDMVKRHPSLTLEAIAKSYWADQERVKR